MEYLKFLFTKNLWKSLAIILALVLAEVLLLTAKSEEVHWGIKLGFSIFLAAFAGLFFWNGYRLFNKQRN